MARGSTTECDGIPGANSIAKPKPFGNFFIAITYYTDMGAFFSLPIFLLNRAFERPRSHTE
eukprot:scaffold80372_cov36-Tisochrysis_lutea.AAC.4